MLDRMQRILKDLNGILQAGCGIPLNSLVSEYNRTYDYAMKRPVFCAQFTYSIFPLTPIKKLSFKGEINQYLSTALIAKA